ncbi:MAG: polysaccharide deacetylase family protein [Magnetococcales bacterium]|nr:polysaccharide deacetylase family protein [Magnetococcales bacterium]
MAHGLMFHHFCDEVHPKGQGAITAAEFSALIDHVGRDRILDAEEWLRRHERDRLGPEDLCLTFDDGLRCQYDIALPVLRRHGLTAFWFVYSSVFEGNVEPLEIYRYFRTVAFSCVEDFYRSFFAQAQAQHPTLCAAGLDGFDPDRYLSAYPFYTRMDRQFRYLRDRVLGAERYDGVMMTLIREAGFDTEALRERLWMTDDQLRILDGEGHRIGLHSYSHPTVLADWPIERQEEEYRRNYEHLSGVLSRPPQVMSHPCNSYHAETLTLLRRLGMRCGFCSSMHPVASRTPLEWPRMDHALLMRSLLQDRKDSMGG